VRELTERAWFFFCLTLGRLLRSARYSRVTIVQQQGDRHVRKERALYAPLLIAMSSPLMTALNTGVTVLAQQKWAEREVQLYRELYGLSVEIDNGRSLVLPSHAGETLATLLENPTLSVPARLQAIESAVLALKRLHAVGVTHGDAMAENVMVDTDAGIARWFDFETVHDPRRPLAWRRADDVRALLGTCVIRVDADQTPEVVKLFLDLYDDREIMAHVVTKFDSAWQRPLVFHLGQAPMSLACFKVVRRLLEATLSVDELSERTS
jgi:serine/threonine protein kinase